MQARETTPLAAARTRYEYQRPAFTRCSWLCHSRTALSVLGQSSGCCASFRFNEMQSMLQHVDLPHSLFGSVSASATQVLLEGRAHLALPSGCSLVALFLLLTVMVLCISLALGCSLWPESPWEQSPWDQVPHMDSQITTCLMKVPLSKPTAHSPHHSGFVCGAITSCAPIDPSRYSSSSLPPFSKCIRSSTSPVRMYFLS